MASPHQPYVPASKSLTEFTIGAIVIGCLLGLVFAASRVHLALKVGLTVSASMSATIFIGSIAPWLVERRNTAGERPSGNEDSGPGVLFSPGLIAGGAILGVGIAALQALRKDEIFTVTHWLGADVTSVTENAVIAMAAYVLLLAVPLYRVARRRGE
jgi:uncharacterized oligopeptide transporter (OPT) family protein